MISTTSTTSVTSVTSKMPVNTGAALRPIRVLLADDHAVTLWGLCQLVESVHPRLCIAGTANSCAALLAHPALPQTDVVLLDLDLGNGNGITGMAASVRRWMVQQGLAAARLTNQLPYTQQHTLVQYRNGYEQAAQRVAQTLPTSATLEVARDLQSDVRVLLGRDWLQFANCLALQSCQAKGTSVALASH